MGDCSCCFGLFPDINKIQFANHLRAFLSKCNLKLFKSMAGWSLGHHTDFYCCRTQPTLIFIKKFWNFTANLIFAKTMSNITEIFDQSMICNFFSFLFFKIQVENILTTYEPHACIVVYSIVDKDSFTKAQNILHYLAMQTCNEKRARILVGNKVDLERSRQVSIQG